MDQKVGDEYIHYSDYGKDFMSVYICQKIKVYTLYICSLLYINYSSIKLLKRIFKCQQR